MPGVRVRVHECFITAVYAEDRLIDVRGIDGANFQRVSYLLPWINSAGSGIDIVPRTGDKCLIMAGEEREPGQGRLVVCLGFQIPTQFGGRGQELGGRVTGLADGSIAIRCLSGRGDEAFLVLSAGGTLFMGANEACSTLYSPIDSSIVNVFNNWELNGPGGFVKWMRQEGDESVHYAAEYRTLAQPEKSGMRVNVRISADNDSPVDVVVHSGDETAPFLRLRVAANGEAFVEGEVINIVGKTAVHIDAPEVKIKNRQVLGQGDPI